MSTNRFNVPGSVASFQKRVLEFQRSLLDNSFDVAARLQDRQREIAEAALERIPNLPEEVKTVSDTWWQARVSGRETLKSAVDRSFSLAESYWDRLADSADSATGN